MGIFIKHFCYENYYDPPIDRIIAIFFTNKAREHNAYGLNKSQTNYVKNQTSFENDVRFPVPQKLIVRGYL